MQRTGTIVPYTRVFRSGSLAMGSERPTSQCRGRTAALTKGRCRGPWHRSPTGNADAFPGRLMASGVAGQPARPALPPGVVGVLDRTDVVDVDERRIDRGQACVRRDGRFVRTVDEGAGQRRELGRAHV